MGNARVRALAASLAADAIRDALPTVTDLADAELYRPEDRAAVVQKLERLANQLMVESMRLEEF